MFVIYFFFKFLFFIVDVLAKFELTIQRILKLVIVLIQCLFILLIIYRRIIQQIFPKQNRPQPYQRPLHQQPPPVNNLAAANILEDPQDSEMLPLY